MSLGLRAYLAAALIVLLAVLGIWLGAPWEGMWRWPAMAWLVLLGYEGWAAGARTLTLVRHCASPATLGERLDYRIELRAGDERGIDAELAESLPAALRGQALRTQLHAQPGNPAWVQHSGITSELGALEWPQTSLRIRGRFGMAWWPRGLIADARCSVVPASLRALDARALSERRGERVASIQGHGLDLLRLREYQPGDPLRRIDWKASARGQRTLVRVMGEDRSMEIVLLIDHGLRSRMAAGTLDRLHTSVNIAAQLGGLALANGDRVQLARYSVDFEWLGRDLHGSAGASVLHAQLSRLQRSNAASNPLTAALACLRGLSQRSLVVILSDIESRHASAGLVEAARALGRRHLCLVASAQDRAIEALACAHSPEWKQPYRMLASAELASEIEHTRARLQKLGAQVVLADADALAEAVIRRYNLLRERRAVG
jgi:uncharacterized protein (DUF58 family)